MKCPDCHQKDQVIPIIYGEPRPEIMEQAELGQLKLGGCLVSNHSPKWYCIRDDREF